MSDFFRYLKNRYAGGGSRAAADNFAWLVCDKVLRLGAGVFVGLVVARYLGPEEFGALNYVLAVTGLILVLVEGGLEPVMRRNVVRAPERAGNVLFAAMCIRGVGAVVAYGGLWLACFSGLVPTEHAGLLLIAGGMFLHPVLMVPDSWFQARLEAGVSVRTQLAALVVGSFARLGFVLADAPLAWFVWATVAETLLTGVMVAARTARRGLRLKPGPGWSSEVRSLWRDSWPLLVSGFSVSVYMRVDAVMLQHFLGEEAVGVYAAATRLGEAGYFVPVALASSVMPALLRAQAGEAKEYRGRVQRYFDLSAGAGIFMAVVLSLSAGPLVALCYGDEYKAAGPVLAVHAWACVFVFIGVARGQLLVNEGLTRFYAMATGMGALLNLGLNLLWIPSYGGMGAAWATVVSYACAAWVSSFAHSRAVWLGRMQTKALLIPFRIWRLMGGQK